MEMEYSVQLTSNQSILGACGVVASQHCILQRNLFCAIEFTSHLSNRAHNVVFFGPRHMLDGCLSRICVFFFLKKNQIHRWTKSWLTSREITVSHFSFVPLLCYIAKTSLLFVIFSFLVIIQCMAMIVTSLLTLKIP